MHWHDGWILILLAALVTSCGEPASTSRSDDVRREIEAAIARSVEATKNQDIDAYMAGIADGALIHDESGAIVTKQEQRANTLRDWSIIPETLSIEVVVDDLEVDGDVATVFTSQRWERLMFQRDGETTDTILTTQKHKELWRETPQGWFAYETEELGGEVFINGERYEP